MKKIILVILALIALPLVIALFLKKSYHVERSITIDKSQSEIYNFIKYVKNQKKFAVWSQYDPNQKDSYIGTDGEVGFINKWESDHEKVGVGEMKVFKMTPYSRIDYKFKFYEPFEALDDSGYFQLEKLNANKTKVIWGYDGKMEYPSNILLLFLNFEEMIGEDFSKGLKNLKEIL